MQTIAARALAARKFARMTQKQAEAASGIKQSNISKIERGDTSRPAGLLALARAYRIDPHWLDTGDGTAPWDEAAANVANEPIARYTVKRTSTAVQIGAGTPGNVPLISWDQAGIWGAAAADSKLRGEPERWLPCIAGHSAGSYALRVRGDSMTPPNGSAKTYPANAIIFVDPERAPRNGERIVARLHAGGEVTFKVFKEEDGRRWLLPLNPTHEPIRAAFEVLGTVIGKWEDEE
jgi:SOS-response transcriptional repressor LexA